MLHIILAAGLIQGIAAPTTSSVPTPNKTIGKIDLNKHCQLEGFTERPDDALSVEAAWIARDKTCYALYDENRIDGPHFRREFLQLACNYCRFGNTSQACVNTRPSVRVYQGLDNYLWFYASFECV